MARLYIANDLFRLVLQAAEELWPDIECDIQFNPEMGDAKGCITFPDDGGRPLVDINIHLPVLGALDILAHELAHVAAGPEEDEHSHKWQMAYDMLHERYTALVEKESAGQAIWVEVEEV